jgi:putative ABC transport system permease protein
MGVLLVLGYKRKAVLMSFMLESVVLCLVGGAVGISLGVALNGLPMKIPMGAFRFIVDATTLGIGLGLAVLIGVIGALFPVLRVARLQTVEALRSE